MKVLVTGGTGFLGRHLVERLVLDGAEVSMLVRRHRSAAALPHRRAVAIPGDVRDWSSLLTAMEGKDLVFHCAARVASTGRWIDFLEDNVLGTERVIQAAIERDVSRIVHVSSVGVYGSRPDGAIVSEDDDYDRAARGFYTRSKIESDQLAFWYMNARTAPVTVIRPGMIYGPGGSTGLVRAGVRMGPLKVVFGNGGNVLPLAYVENVVDALVLAARREEARGRAYNIVDAEEVSQRVYIERMGPALGDGRRAMYAPLAMVRALAFAADVARSVRRGRRPPQGLFQRIRRSLQSVRYDTSRAAVELGWKPRVGFEEALTRIREAPRR